MRSIQRLLAGMAFAAMSVSVIAQGGPPEDPLGPDVFIAIRSGNMAELKSLLGKGAKLEARNWLGITPLQYAAMTGNPRAVDVLLSAGANIETGSNYGSALYFAMVSPNPDLPKKLIERGAKPEPHRLDGISPLMMAASYDNLEAIDLLIKSKAKVNGKDIDGLTPLMWAATHGRIKAAEKLISAGAEINAIDGHKRTALMYAAQEGHADVVRLITAKGANVNLRDESAMTALLLDARYAGSAEVARILIANKADSGMKDARGRTASEVAIAYTTTECAKAIDPAVPVSLNETPGSLVNRASRAVQKSIPLIDMATKKFSDKMPCSSCHHQGVSLWATALAKERGFAYDEKLNHAQLKLVVDDINSHGKELAQVAPMPAMHKFVPAVDMKEYVPGISFTFSGLAAHKVPADPSLSAATIILAAQQEEDGHFGFDMHREPVQSSQFTTTALSIRVLQNYMPKDRAKETERRIAKAGEWMLATPADTTEDRTFKLLGLKWSGAPEAEIAKAAEQLWSAQRADGGWAQLPTMRSDAYATGEALYALSVAGGTPTTDGRWAKGMAFLVRTQDDEGSWYVHKRATPANNYFDAGFPHGESQYASYAATCWASMALMLAAEPPTKAALK